MTSILFVCLGNICRSPAAEGILRHMAQKEQIDLHIESCGLGDWHSGHLPDERMRDAIKKRGITLLSRAQKIQPEFFDRFDMIFVADNKVMNELYKHALLPDHKNKLHLMTHFSASYRNQEVPDPYYGGEAGFEQVLDMLEDSCAGIIDHIKKRD
jgi:low molecular weight protein-tyrosine phosphatase